MKITLLLLSTGIILLGCKREKICDCVVPYEIYYLKAKVVATRDLACYSPILDFSDDSVRIRQQTNLDSLSYLSVNLPANYSVIGKKLYVSVTEVQPGDEIVCNALGVIFPQLKIVDAKPRE